MSKFKVGDKVEYIGTLVRRSFRPGTVYEVGGKYHEAFDADRCGIEADDQGDANGLPDSNFRLVGEALDADTAVYLRDLDGTGSMHVCAKGDPGAVRYVRDDE